MKPEQIWQAALGELKMQMSKATFETWVKPSKVVSFENNTFTVEVPTAFIKEWLESKLLSSIERSLTGITGRTVEVKVIVQANAQAEPNGSNGKSSSGHASIWQTALGELQKDVSKATFETWLKTTRVLAYQDGMFTIAVPTLSAKDWLESKLLASIKRSLSGVVNRPVEVTFVVKENGWETDLEPGDIPIDVELASFDPLQQGFVQTSNYAFRFWQPLIGVTHFAVWQTLRAFAYRMPREQPISKSIYPSIQTLADICTNGDRHKLLGRAERSGKFPRPAQPGILQNLQEQRLLWMQITGEDNKTRYRFRVLDHLPLLTPTQVAQLSRHLQKAHERFLAACEIERQIWEKLTEPTLAPKVEDMVELVVSGKGNKKRG